MRSIMDLGIWLVPIAAIVVWGVIEIVKDGLCASGAAGNDRARHPSG
jgi:hypothetical protein